GRGYPLPSALIAFTGNVVPMSAPEYTTNCPSGDQTGLRAWSRPNGSGGRPSNETLKRRGTPPSSAAAVIDCPSGAQAGAPCHASDVATALASVPSEFMT